MTHKEQDFFFFSLDMPIDIYNQLKNMQINREYEQNNFGQLEQLQLSASWK